MQLLGFSKLIVDSGMKFTIPVFTSQFEYHYLVGITRVEFECSKKRSAVAIQSFDSTIIFTPCKRRNLMLQIFNFVNTGRIDTKNLMAMISGYKKEKKGNTKMK